ncbi:hypothetical protein R1flu_022744 [Riccia fluitans]|uniref:Transposase n=1 Tax=Riccia fluitans TaxID=41844 RepID=A0ABD1XQ69_9MARC
MRTGERRDGGETLKAHTDEDFAERLIRDTTRRFVGSGIRKTISEALANSGSAWQTVEDENATYSGINITRWITVEREGKYHCVDTQSREVNRAGEELPGPGYAVWQM